jgi:hypothetical protein
MNNLSNAVHAWFTSIINEPCIAFYIINRIQAYIARMIAERLIMLREVTVCRLVIFYRLKRSRQSTYKDPQTGTQDASIYTGLTGEVGGENGIYTDLQTSRVA